MPDLTARELVPVNKDVGIRFLTLVSSLIRGGMERTAVNFALGYHRAGFPSAVFAYNGGGPREAQLKAEGIPVFIGSENPSEFAQAAEEARAWKPDILHLNRPGIADESSAAALRELIHPRLRVLETNVFGYVDDSADRVMIDLHLLLSRWCLWKWTQSSKGLKSRSPGVVVPNSIDTPSFSPIAADQHSTNRRAFGIPEEAFVFGRIGQATPPKWSPGLITAFEAVAKAKPDAWLAACGMPDFLREMAAKLPGDIRNRIVELPITNSDAELRRYYGLMDAFVHVSEKGESFGLVLCEAMLCELPVITMSTPLRDNSQIEVVPNGKAGIVVQSLPQLIRAMLDCQRDSMALQAMRRNARQSVIDRFDIPVVTQRLVTLAKIALASQSSEDLARRLNANGAFETQAPPTLYKELLAAAGLRQSLSERILLPLVNQPFSRKAISFTRAVQSRFR